MNSFTRGNDIKESLGLGIPTYRIYRMWIFRSDIPDGMGFYIMDAAKTCKVLKGVSSGKKIPNRYIIEFPHLYEELDGAKEMMLHSLPTCFLSYSGKKYFMDSKILKSWSRE